MKNKIHSIASFIISSALMACSLSAVSSSAADVTLNADVTKSANLVNNIDSLIRLRGSMPLKGDINGDKKVTSEDTTVLEVYLKGLINIKPSSTAYRVLDVNWDGKLDKNDLTLMPKNNTVIDSTKSSLLPLTFNYLHTGDFNSDGIVNSKDFTMLRNKVNSLIIDPLEPLEPIDPIIRIDDQVMLKSKLNRSVIILRPSIYDLNQDGKVNMKDCNLLDSYISYQFIRPVIAELK